MPRELVTIQVGQCGNQLGLRFWDLALKEHAKYNANALFDESMSSFFRNVDSRYSEPLEIPVGNSKNKIRTLKARAVLIDMEEGVVQRTLKSSLGDLFDNQQFLTGISGSGNNWAHGYASYGVKYREEIEEKIRRTVEFCESLQSFFLLHSLGGGTGSGLGSYILEMLEDSYPEVFRLNCSVFPSSDDDVITSPYNSVLSLKALSDHSDCVLPIENEALMDILKDAESAKGVKSTVAENQGGQKDRDKNPYDGMNNIAANMLLNLTSSSRFAGSLNIDMNEVAMNMVPFPGLNYLIPSLSPLALPKDLALPLRRLDNTFSDVFDIRNQLIKSDPQRGTYFACALMVRGKDIGMSDIRRNISRLRPKLSFANWSTDGWKVGLCHTPPTTQPHSILCLANNTAITQTLQRIKDRYSRLARSRAHMHHYTEYIEEEMFKQASQSLQNTIELYSEKKMLGHESSEGSRLRII